MKYMLNKQIVKAYYIDFPIIKCGFPDKSVTVLTSNVIHRQKSTLGATQFSQN